MFAVASKTTVAAPRAANLIRQTNRRQSAAKCRRNRVATNEVAPSAPAMSNRNPSAEVIELIQSASAFCFDVDSTVCVDEGIDELAAFLGKGEEVAELTRRAMGGSVSFRDALEARLQVMQPTKEAVETYVMENPPKLSPGIKDLFDVLRANGKAVYLVSGGFRHMINPVADALDVPRENIYANDLRFKADGSYDSFNPEEFTSAAGGKAEAVKHIKRTDGHEVMGMVGDGATDLESRAPGGADVFVGYGGVQVRETVEAGADWFITDFDAFIDVVKGSDA